MPQIDSANQDSLIKLEFLAVCLTTEVIKFSQRYPSTKPAGLVLTADILLPVFEPLDAFTFMEADKGDKQ